MPAVDSCWCTKEGFLLKRSSRGQWQRRYFYQRGPFLAYSYSSTEMDDIKAIIDLKKLASLPRHGTDMRVLVLKMEEIEYHLKADNIQDATSWLQSFEQAAGFETPKKKVLLREAGQTAEKPVCSKSNGSTPCLAIGTSFRDHQVLVRRSLLGVESYSTVLGTSLTVFALVCSRAARATGESNIPAGYLLMLVLCSAAAWTFHARGRAVKTVASAGGDPTTSSISASYARPSARSDTRAAAANERPHIGAHALLNEQPKLVDLVAQHSERHVQQRLVFE